MKKSWILGKKEFFTNIKSIRMLIIIFIFAIIVLASAYGISMTQNIHENKDYMFFTHTIDRDDDGWNDDLMVYTLDQWGDPLEDRSVILYNDSSPAEIKKTNKNGLVIFKNISNYVTYSKSHFQSNLNLELQLKNVDNLGMYYGRYQGTIGSVRDLRNKSNFNEVVKEPRYDYISRDKDDKGSQNDFIFHILTPNGEPSKDAKLLINETKKTAADDDGFIKYEISPGLKNITLTDRYGNVSFERNIRRENRAPLYEGPDYILSEMTNILLFIVPFLTIALAYDSISKEKETNSLFLLITRPIKKWKILIGKLLGNFASITIPFTIVNIVGILGVWYISGKSPSGKLCVLFIISTLGTILIYLSLQMIVSTFSKSSGTAILGGAGLWLFFNLFYFIMISAISSIFGLQTGSFTYYKTQNILELFNPNMVFQKTFHLIYEDVNYQYYTGIPNYSIYLALLLWIIIPMIILTYIFHKRITK